MTNQDQEFFDSNKIVLETLDNVDEYTSTIDAWIDMHDESAKDIIGSESFGYCVLHVFDKPVDIVTADGEVLDTFQAAISIESPGKLADRDTISLTFPTEQEARAQLEELRDKFEDFWMAEQDKVENMVY